ncbi:MAG: hypothetical protein ACKVZ6_01705 [Kineosporiaceae bacterium]
MTTSSTARPPVAATRVRSPLQADPARQAFVMLRTVFTLAPVLFGLDKFANVLTDWPMYLAPRLNDLLPGSGQQAMYVVGVVEVVAGLAVAVRPRFGAPLVALWLLGIVVDLLLVPGFYDVALRDVGLFVAAVALWRLAVAQSGTRSPSLP